MNKVIQGDCLEIIKCQCPEKGYVPPTEENMYLEEEKNGMNHEPGHCKGTYKIKKYKRGDKELYLCSCCNILGDIEIKAETNK